MKKKLIVFVMLISMHVAAGCGQAGTATVEATATPQVSDWEYDAATKTLVVNNDAAMENYFPNKQNEEGTITNAPWADYLSEIEVIVVGDDVTYIGDYAFAFAAALKEVTVGTGVNALNWRCFYRCGDWENQPELRMTFNCASLPSFGEDVFGYTWDNNNAWLNVPEDQQEGWYSYLGNYAINIENLVYEPEPTLSNDPMEIAGYILSNPQIVGGQGGQDNAAGGGNTFSGEASKYASKGGTYLVLENNKNAAIDITCNDKLLKENTRNNNQGVLVKFMPMNSESLGFSLVDSNEIIVKMNGSLPYFVHVNDNFEAYFSDSRETAFVFENGRWYWILMAVDQDSGGFRTIVWEDGNPLNNAVCEQPPGASNNDFRLHIQLAAGESVGIMDYWIIDFDGFHQSIYDIPYMMKGSLQAPYTQEQADNMPKWSFRVNDYPGTYEDFINAVESVKLESDGQVYYGFQVKGLITYVAENFSQSNGEFVEVEFDSQNNKFLQISDTADAYIVYMQNGEFIGGPYLFYNDELMDNPIVMFRVSN